MKQCLFPLFFISSFFVAAQKPIAVADQTFRLDGKSEYIFAFAEGDDIQLFVQELTGKKNQVRGVLAIP